MSSEIASQDVVVVPWWAFTIWWFVFLAVHLITCSYNMAYAIFYWWLDDTTIAQYLVFYRVGLQPNYYGVVATVYLIVSLIHVVCILLMVGSSIWLRRLSFTPWNGFKFFSTTSSPKLKNEIQIIKVRARRRSSSSLNSAILKRVSTLTERVTNRHGILGVNGKHFHVIYIAREFVETTLQTIQAYRMSHFLPSTLLNRFYVISVVLNCWSPVIVYSLFFQSNEGHKRFACLVSDLILNLMSNMGVTFIVVLSYIGQYDPETTDFGLNPWYNDEWAAVALNEFQMVLVVSWSDLASRAIFSLGLLMTTTNLKELLYSTPRHANRVVAISNKPVDIPTSLAVKSTCSLKRDMPSVRLIPGRDNGRPTVRKICIRVREFAMRVIFFVWGVGILGLHIQASVQASLHQCTLQVRPWAVSRPYCFLVCLDCHRLGISGHLEEIDTKWREFDGSTAVMMVIKHCPSLDIPDIFAEFHQLISTKVYNSTIVEWRNSAAITNSNHPEFLSLMLVRVNMTDGQLPEGFQSTEMPINLYDFEFCITNLRELPDDLDTKWYHGSYIIIEYSQLEIVPATLLRIMPSYFSLSGNPISELPPEIFEIEGLTDLGIADTKIRQLPQNVTQVSSTLTSIYVEGTNISYFWSWTDQFLGRPSVRDVPRSIYASGSIYCNEIEGIKNGSAKSFSSVFSSNYSTQLMNSTNARPNGGIWSFVDCNPPISGISGPLYPLTAEDKQNGINS
ncbi:hypothetical protein PHMEG_00028264 [Phytophthora megakarya]|uniref:Uncharacterized protein n=1 Tax=Phytophthora megakarya TaxID=4795 RepID=A0A225V5A8_9STRA|nr:hypothetical protein PHMEG_00028264 [Phytophthora megakarya]